MLRILNLSTMPEKYRSTYFLRLCLLIAKCYISHLSISHIKSTSHLTSNIMTSRMKKTSHGSPSAAAWIDRFPIFLPESQTSIERGHYWWLPKTHHHWFDLLVLSASITIHFVFFSSKLQKSILELDLFPLWVFFLIAINWGPRSHDPDIWAMWVCLNIGYPWLSSCLLSCSLSEWLWVHGISMFS